MGGALFLLCLLSWWYLVAGAGMGAPSSMMHAPDTSRWAVMLLMWWIMMIAMMIPSAAPMVLLYARVYRKGQESGRLRSPFVPTAAFAGGYLLAWLLFSVLAVALQSALESSGLVHRMMMWSTSERLSGSFLILAGLYQFSPWKNRCLAHCRSPAEFLSAHWRKSAAGAVRMGIEHGLYCVGCCWSLMLLLFVGGVMNLVWIAVLAAIVLAEKLLPFGRRIAIAVGALMLAGGAYLLASSRAMPPPDPAPRHEAAAFGEVPASPETGLAEAFVRIDEMLVRRREADGIPGMAAGVVHGGGLAWARGYGVTDLADPRPVTPATRFRVASVTKVFTATAVMKLAEEGALALTDPVHRHLDWFELRRPPVFGPEPVTIEHLLTHTGGLPRDSALTDFGRLFQPAREQAISVLPTTSLQSPPGASMAYSNLGYGVLGEVIAKASGMSYAAFIEREILAPLGMSRTLVHPVSEDDVAWGHGPRAADGSRSRAGFWELGFATPAGGMAASVEDLARFMLLQLAPYDGTAPRILSAAALRVMHEVHYMADPDRGGVGLGWAVEISNGQHLVYHGGELPEQTSFMLIDLRTGVGIVVLTNAEDVDAGGMAQDILQIVRAAIPDSPTPTTVRPIPPA